MLCASLQVNLSADTAQHQQRKSYMYQKVNDFRLMCSRFYQCRRISA
jgi:hypothetical protein